MDVPEISSSAAGAYDYDVFLSFRGSDVRLGFADVLYHSLMDAGVRVFRDDEELAQGDFLPDGLLQAIKRSRISIPIFSKDYASSRYLLEEVVGMLECREREGHKVIPIFYDVDPGDVRNQRGTIGESFACHEERGVDTGRIQTWRQALHEVTSLRGWELRCHGFSEVVKRIVSEVLRILKMDVSESSSLAAGAYDYDVFLSFRGSDVRLGFADVLYHGLTNAGVRVFREDEGLAEGDYTTDALLQAMKRSRISIPIFSKNYASSRFLLEEVVRMVECREREGHMVIPIFYDVDPRDVRKQRGIIGESFPRHEKRGVDRDRIQTWRHALHEVASLKGWELHNNGFGRSLGEAVKRIVSDVLRLLQLDVSESSSSDAGAYDYDVFLSFRGSDVRLGIADVLYHGLTNAGVRVFLDNEGLVRGDLLPDALLQGIKRSRISIPIFSKNYASSRFCLEEVVGMLECREREGHMVIPIFYDVDPSDVRNQTGIIGKSFAGHEKRGVDPDRIQTWRQALQEVVSLKGLEVLNNGLSKVMKWIVSEVLRKLQMDKPQLPRLLVGFDDRVEAVMNLLDVNAGGVRMVGIYGMGGIGKTTLAKAVYNRLCNFFGDHRCFLPDIREISMRPMGLLRLQHQLVCEVLRQENVFITDYHEGIHFIRRKFCHKRVMVVLDDVDSREQLDALAGAPDWFGPGSRIIITTRSLDVLDKSAIFGIYEVEPMSEHEALQLLSRHAFRTDFPPKDYYNISVGIVSSTGGLPLALEVVGSFLLGKRKDVWEETLQKVKKVPFQAVRDKLQIGYDALEQEEKEIFLDIACFLTGEDMRVACYMWEDSGFSPYLATGRLSNQSFMKVGKNRELQMHDQLGALGREIVRAESPREPGKRSRLWNHDEAFDVLKKRKGTGHVEALCLTFGDDSCNSFTSSEFDGLSNLRFLRLDRASIQGDFGDHLSRLRWLNWEGCKKLDDLLNLHLEKLVVLDLSNSQVTGDPNTWIEVMKMAASLRVLLLNSCPELRISPCFPAEMRLEILSFEGCTQLREIDPSIGNLKELKYLNLNFCVHIDHLPEELGLMENLEELLIDGTSIRNLHFTEGSLKQLEVLSASSCTNLAQIPDSIGHLESLIYLCLDNLNAIGLWAELQGFLLGIKDLKIKISNSKIDITSGTLATHFEVFLSFCTHNEIASSLYEDMKSSGISAFGVDEELNEDKEVGKKLFWAIDNSDICIPIFTKDYASHVWCLRGLSHMMECQRYSVGQQVVPIFYDVEPSDVKLETDLYINALKEHKENFSVETVRQWEESLREVAELKGWKCKAEGFKRYSKFVVSATLNKLKGKHGNVLVGLHGQAEELKRVLDLESRDVLFVIIHGIGGIGKTTLAKAVFDQLSAHFEGYSFLRDIRETSKHKGLKYLQDQLLRDILGADTDYGTRMISHRFLEKKVLIVLDDVDDRGQIKKLVGKSNRFVAGSRIIVTTRDINVLVVENEARDRCFVELPEEVRPFKMEGMKFSEALQLFSIHAFGKVLPPDDYLITCERVVSVLRGLPLALEIIGSSLTRKPENVWKATVEKLENPLDQELHSKLMISYEALDNEAKEIFLDIACFFNGREKSTAIHMWDACEHFPEEKLEVLIFTSFIKILGDNRLWMHDEVRDFGRKIVSGGTIIDSAKGSRLWANKEVLDVLRSKEENGNVRGLRLHFDEFLRECTFPNEELGRLLNLRFLELSGFPFAVKRGLPKLRWLSWHFCPSDVAATNLHLENLTILDLSHSQIGDHQLGESGQLGMAKNLKVLNLTGCKSITKTPIFSECMILERLILENCENLVEIDSSIGKLKQLVHLNLNGCNSLKALPDELSSANALTEIVMKGNGQSFNLQESITGLTSLLVLEIDHVKIVDPLCTGKSESLERLTLSECTGIKELPESCQFFQSLVMLDLSRTEVTKLPDSIGDMKKLKVINMEYSLISELPKSIGKLEKLEELLAKHCEGLQGEIPSEIGTLSSLIILDLSFTRISSLPPTLSKLSNLQTLNLEFCHELRELSVLPKSLVTLHVMSKKLEELPDLLEMSSLTDLQLFCAVDKFQTNIGKLSRLEKLELYIPRIKTLEFGVTSQLGSLSLSCREIETLPQLPSTLLRLSVAHLNGTMKFPSISNLKRLTFLEFYSCSMGSDEFRNLGVVELKSLDHLSASKCNFSSISGPLLPERLKVLCMTECEFLDGLLDLSSLKSLMRLEIMNCQLLTEIRGLGKLESVEEIIICYCNSLETLGDLSDLEKLEALHIDSCEKLVEVKGLGRVKSLKRLEIYGCKSLERSVHVSNSRLRKRDVLT
ncbi:uncharacterized protein LOC116187207 [Punica granatum]|uniref:Uncharacterized protein LOC116187207 n=1 Tax=Punica granatum TaxID=22663 RepID=A0A6P8BN37_PUNGR|nr:uncharacterized protein LOC116187207 [Punica granatum]XP_031371699.1 uncharacterized protein LOC116187207 [Punica granatum]